MEHMKTVRAWERARFEKHANGPPLCRGEVLESREIQAVKAEGAGRAQNLWINRGTRSSTKKDANKAT